jgi:hypothetical protein
MNKIKKLNLKSETVRVIVPAQLTAAVGGMNGTYNCTDGCTKLCSDDSVGGTGSIVITLTCGNLSACYAC